MSDSKKSLFDVDAEDYANAVRVMSKYSINVEQASKGINAVIAELAKQKQTDLEKLKKCLDDIGVEYKGFLGRDDITTIRVQAEGSDATMDFDFRFNGSFFGTE
jgi:hypothetical protein